MPQGTIKTYDETTRTGVVVDDARNEVSFDQESFRGTGMRMFRIGQRVSYELIGAGERASVRNLRILTV